jgi:hypothetical protein
MSPNEARFAAVVAVLLLLFAANVAAAIIDRKRNK